MADQMRTNPDSDLGREVDWAERLRASMNDTSEAVDEPAAPVIDEEDDLAALLRAQLARGVEDATPDLPDTAEFEEEFEEEELEEEPEDIPEEEEFEEESEDIPEEEEFEEEPEEIFEEEEPEEIFEEEEFEEELEEEFEDIPEEEELEEEPEEIFEEEDVAEEDLSDAHILSDNTLNGGVTRADGDRVQIAPSQQARLLEDDLRVVREENAKVLEEEKTRREAVVHGFSAVSDDLDTSSSSISDAFSAEKTRSDQNGEASDRLYNRPAVIGYDPLQVDHSVASVRTISDILDSELPVGAYAKPDAGKSNYIADMVGTSTEEVHLRDTALWMDLGYAADVRHAEERRAAEQTRSDDAPIAQILRDAERLNNSSIEERIRTARAQLEAADKKTQKMRRACFVRFLLVAVGALIALLYGVIPAVREYVSEAIDPVAYPLFSLGWLLLLALPFITRLVRGAADLFRFAPTIYSVTSLAVATTALYTALAAITGEALPLLESVPLCMLTVAALSEWLEESGKGDSLSLLASGRAAYVLSDEDTPAATALGHHISDDLIPNKRPSPLTVQKTAIVDHALARVRQYNPYMGLLNYLLPAALGLAIVVFGVTLLRDGELLADGVRLFATVYLAALPAAYLLAMSMPLQLVNRRMRGRGCAVIGTASSEDYVRPRSARHKCEFFLSERDVIVAARRKEITLRDDAPADINAWRRMANRVFHLLEMPLAVDLPLEDDGSPEALAHLHVEIAESDAHYLKVYLIDENPADPKTTEMLMGSHDALSRRGIRLPKRSMESVYRKSEDSHVIYLAFNGRFRIAYATEYRVDQNFLDMAQGLGKCGMRPVMVSYDPMLTSAMLVEPRFSALGNMEVIRPDYTEVTRQFCSSGVVAVRGSHDLLHPLVACRRMRLCYRFAAALAWMGYASVAILALASVLTNHADLFSPLWVFVGGVVSAAVMAFVTWSCISHPLTLIKKKSGKLATRITKK